MTRFASMLVLALTIAVCGLAGDRSGGTPIPHRVIPMEEFAVFVNNWNDSSMPHYAIIGNIQEWKAEFSPAATMGNNKPFQPDPALFNDNVLVAISRVSDAPAPGQKVLILNSLVHSGGEAVVTYTFLPPAGKATHKVKNTLLIMMPAKFQDGIRFIEDEQTPESLAAQAELEAAKAAGRFKPQPLPQGQQPIMAPPPQQAQPMMAPPPQQPPVGAPRR